MASYFCISVQFLDGTFHGRCDSAAPEWPPSPLRLFQALVGACAARWNEREWIESAAPMLRWLERCGDPEIIAPMGQPAKTPYCLSVPNNALDIVARAWSRGNDTNSGDANPATHRVMKTIRPTRLRGGDTVHYLWRLADSDSEFEKFKETLLAAPHSITHVGWGVDLVAAGASVKSGDDAAKLCGDRWVPTHDRTASAYRAPVSGTLAALAARHKSFLKRFDTDANHPRLVPPLTAGVDFRLVGYRRASDPPSRRYAAFAFQQSDMNAMLAFPMLRAAAVAAMVRDLTANIARQSGHCETGSDMETWVEEYALGKNTADGPRKRFSYLPLPTIRPPGVLSDVRRVIIAESLNEDGTHAAWARRALAGALVVGVKRSEQALIVPLGPNDGVLSRYVARSDTWAAVTPVVLPGSDEGKPRNTEKLFAKALHQAGYYPDDLADVEFRNVSFWPGGDLALRFERPEYLKRGCWSVYHVRLRWREPIAGPLAIGAGRHCGLGIFAAWPNQ